MSSIQASPSLADEAADDNCLMFQCDHVLLDLVVPKSAESRTTEPKFPCVVVARVHFFGSAAALQSVNSNIQTISTQPPCESLTFRVP